VRGEECFISEQRPQFGPLATVPTGRRAQPRQQSHSALAKFYIQIRRRETGLGEDISQSSPPKETPPANARQRIAALERRVGC